MITDDDDEDRMLDQLHLHPNDWRLWSVFADWLMDQGDARGELLRLQHRLATATLSAAESETLQQQVEALIGAHEQEWLAGWTPPDNLVLQWRGGFIVGAILLYWDTMRDHQSDLDVLVAHPAACLLNLLKIKEGAANGVSSTTDLVRTEALRSFMQLDLSGNEMSSDHLYPLAKAGTLEDLSRLDLSSNRIEYAGMLFSSWFLPSLTELDLSDNDLGSRISIFELDDPCRLHKLLKLQLARNRLGHDHARELANCEQMCSLVELDLAGNHLGDEGALALASSQYLRSLTRLDLGHNHIGDDGARSLANSEVLSSVSELELVGNRIGDDGVRALAQSRALRFLTRLDLRDNPISAGGYAIVAESQWLRSCQILGGLPPQPF